MKDNMSKATDKSEEKPNRLVSLKILIFLFFGALTCVYAYLPYHMEWLGFTRSEIRNITLVASLVSIIGPLIVGFILDRVSVKRPSAYGKWLRVLLFICFIATGIFFGLLLVLDPAGKIGHNSTLTFSCNDHGGHLFVKKQGEETCADLTDLSGHLQLFNCSYTCEVPENFDGFHNPNVSQFKNNPAFERLQLEASSEGPSQEEDYDEDTIYNDSNATKAEALTQVSPTTEAPAATSAPMIHPPHICFNNGSHVNCPVYLDGVTINFQKVSGIKKNNDSNAFSENWCKHPLGGFSCNVPKKQVEWMQLIRVKQNITECAPSIECLVKDPQERGSILENSILAIINKEVPYEAYYTLRIIAEIFPIIIHMLLNISIVIATRENNNLVGRGDIGHQWVFYPIGVLVFASVLGVINHGFDIERFFIPMIVFVVTMFVCAIVVLFSGKLPLTPSDWWWHTKCGLLAIPMSALKRYKWVIISIALTAFILGGLWHIQEAFRHIFSIDIIEDLIIEHNKNWRSKTFVYVIGAVIAIPIIWNGEKVVDTLGHSNIFILAFISFALRFGGLYFDSTTELASLYELFEPVSFYLAWFALLLFNRHLVPKRFLALGQGLLVILFFALGRGLGFFYGVSVISEPKRIEYLKLNETIANQNQVIDLQNIHSTATVIAFTAALIYFVIYHLILLPRYHVPTNRLTTNTDSGLSPHVFHDERSRKGYFRY